MADQVSGPAPPEQTTRAQTHSSQPPHATVESAASGSGFPANGEAVGDGDVQMENADGSDGGGEGDRGQRGSEDEDGTGDMTADMDESDLQLQNDIKAQVEGAQQEPQQDKTAAEQGTERKGEGEGAASEGQPHPQAQDATNAPSTAEEPSGVPPTTSFVPPELDRFSAHDVPSNIARIRQLLFELREPIEMSVGEFAIYWPYIDNIWVKHRPQSTRSGNYVTDYYMCRLRRKTGRSKPQGQQPQRGEPAAEGKKPRAKAVREGPTCNVQMKIVKFEGAVTTITISRTPNSSLTHSHDLDHIDNVKRNSGLMGVIWKEAEKAYLPASIFTKFREDPVRLAGMGGKFMRASDVRNVCAKWRASNPTVPLRTHAGYQLAHGLGVIMMDDGVQQQQQQQQYQAHSTAAAPPIQNNTPTATAGPTAYTGIQAGTPSRAPNFPPPGGPAATPPQPQHVPPPEIPPDALPFPRYSLEFLEPYLPRDTGYRKFPHVTLTYASSMDSKISLLPGVQTHLSGPESKAMTHYLRSRHDAVLIGVRTALADDPGLNCRLEGAGGYGGLGRLWQPRPVIVDPTGKWPVNPENRLMKTASEGKGKAPWVAVSPGAVVPPDKLALLKSYGGDYLRLVDYNAFWRLRWEAILAALAAEGIRSVMIEGGGTVISELLNPEYTDFVDSLIVTVAPTFLGSKGLGVAPDAKYDGDGKPRTAMAPREVKWQPLGQDVVMCGKVRVPPPLPPPPRPPVPPGQAAASGPSILEGIEAVAQGER